MSSALASTDPDTKIDSVVCGLIGLIERGEARMADITAVHRFAPGLYMRECRIPAGTLLVSEIHKTEHLFMITEGVVRVFSENEGDVYYAGGHIGKTKPGTRRVLYTEVDTVWITFHVTNETDVEKIGASILDDRPIEGLDANPLLHQWLSQLPTTENLLT